MGLFKDSPRDISDSSRSASVRTSNANEDKRKAQAAADKRAADFQREAAAARQASGQQTAPMMEANAKALADAKSTGSKVGGAVGSIFGSPGTLAGSAFGRWLAGESFSPEVIPGASPQSLTDQSGNPVRETSRQMPQYSSGSSNSNQPGVYQMGAYQGGGDDRSPGQIEMDRQNAFLQYAGGLYDPSIQRGEQAQSTLFDYYSGNQQPMQDRVNQSVMNSPFLAQNIAQGEDAIARNRQATGGFRSGTTQENLAQNSQNQYQNMYNQQLNQNLQGLGMFGDYGANALNNYSNFGRGMINDIGTTAGNIESINVAKDANKQNQQNAWIGALGGALGTGLGAYFGS